MLQRLKEEKTQWDKEIQYLEEIKDLEEMTEGPIKSCKL